MAGLRFRPPRSLHPKPCYTTLGKAPQARRPIPPSGLASAIVTQWLAKSVYEAAVTPLTCGVMNLRELND